ncbi:hypothetical protein KC19_10G103000 [Ceratodon purpureus]|uniref:Uncharacterized protein n=1 Tax=Ceratodon purpureus TaxID=3225 RepID=A0A8T0GNV1_CERPU|nr:hypothetical protein KC19_10G103000 [Ceratodon purpureus]
MPPARAKIHGAREKGDPRWFHEEEGLNRRGYVPGAAATAAFSLPHNVASKSMCERRWGPMKGGKFWYAKPGQSESPRQCYRIERLYQITHQRPIGRYKCIGLAFARGLIAEKRGFAVDWATFAAKICARGKKEFKTFEELRRHCREIGEPFPPNEIKKLDLDEDSLTGAPDDWLVNRNPDLLDPNLLQGFDLTLALPGVMPNIVHRPLYCSFREGEGYPTETEDETDASDDDILSNKTPQGATASAQGGDLANDMARSVPARDDSTPAGKGKRKHDDDVYIIEQMNDRAMADGYHHMTGYQKLSYLYDRGDELDAERLKRKAVEDVQESWLKSERAQAVQRGIENMMSDSDELFQPPGGTQTVAEDHEDEDYEDPAPPTMTSPYSPLPFKRLPLQLPKDTQGTRTLAVSDDEEESA